MSKDGMSAQEFFDRVTDKPKAKKKREVAGKMVSEKDRALAGRAVLGMYDRDFRKPFNKKDYDAVNRAHKKVKGKPLSN